MENKMENKIKAMRADEGSECGKNHSQMNT